MKLHFRILAAALCVLLLLPCIPAQAEERGFSDVSEDAWYYDSVTEAAARGLMNGMTATAFLPEEATTRAMLLTVLYRLDGALTHAESAPFPDVPTGTWYSDAAAWGAKEKIVGGFEDGTFRPNVPVSREQAALILRRYAQARGYDVSDTAALSDFGDAAQVSDWAREALAWAVGCGLVGGANGMLLPLDGATRAETAALLCRFCDRFPAAQFSAHGFTIAYLPLDNRPVNDLRPLWLAESCGIRLLMPDEALYATRLDGQSLNPNGTSYGDRAALLQWLKDNEAQCDAFVISLDQLLSGGLVSSRALCGTELSFEISAIDYLAELSARKPVYVFDTVMRLASTVGYQGLGLEEYMQFRAYGAVARRALTGDALTIENICRGYRFDENGAEIQTELSAQALESYLRARERKLRLADRMLQKSEDLAYFWIGVDDSVPQTSIQTNEIAYLRARLGENAALFCAADELGMMGITRAYLDLCKWVPTLSVRYFGGQEDSYADAFDIVSLREAVEQHITALGCTAAEQGGAAEVLVLTRVCTDADEAAFLQAWQDNDAAGRPTIVIDASGSGRAPEPTVRAMSLKYLLGYSAWGTAANALGIGLSMGVARLAWLSCESAPQTSDSEAFAKGLIFAFVKDLAYYRRCRAKLNDLTPAGIEACLLDEPLTQEILGTFDGAELTASKSGAVCCLPRPTLTDFSAPFARTYEVDFLVQLPHRAAP